MSGPLPRRWSKVCRVLLALALALAPLGDASQMAQLLHRPIRALSYPSGSNMGIFFALAVPLEDPANSVSISYFFEANYGLPSNTSFFRDLDTVTYSRRRRRSIDRGTVYSVIQSKLQSAGFPGHGCLLRSICEASEHPLGHNGVLGDLLQVVFTPSSSRQEDHLPDGVIEAELRGRSGSCSRHYEDLCPLGLFDLIGVFL